MGSRLILYLRVGEPRPMPPLMSEAVPIENPLYAEYAVSSHVVDEETESGDSRSQTTRVKDASDACYQGLGSCFLSITLGLAVCFLEMLPAKSWVLQLLDPLPAHHKYYHSQASPGGFAYPPPLRAEGFGWELWPRMECCTHWGMSLAHYLSTIAEAGISYRQCKVWASQGTPGITLLCSLSLLLGLHQLPRASAPLPTLLPPP